MLDAVQGQDTSVWDTISKGRFDQGAQHPRIFGRGHIGRGHINPASKNPIYVFFFWELPGLSPNLHIHVSVSDVYIPRICTHIYLQQNRQTDSLRHMSVGTGRKNIIRTSVLEITVSFLEIYKWELDIYIGFSTAPHLQCSGSHLSAVNP
jgi:hypothetical protein